MFIMGTTQISNLKPGSFVLLCGGFGLFLFGLFSAICGCCIIDKLFERRIEPAIVNESKKYSTRSPTPCFWRLQSKTVFRRRGRSGRLDVIQDVKSYLFKLN